MKKYASSLRKRKKKVETSKKLLIFSVAMVMLITIVAVIAVFVLQDPGPLEFLIGGSFGLASTAFGFYYWKAKNENIAKYGNNVDDDNEM